MLSLPKQKLINQQGVTMDTLDTEAMLQRFKERTKVVKTIEPIDVTACPGFSLTYGYLA
jgi:hypothetical protein